MEVAFHKAAPVYNVYISECDNREIFGVYLNHDNDRSECFNRFDRNCIFLPAVCLSMGLLLEAETSAKFVLFQMELKTQILKETS